MIVGRDAPDFCSSAVVDGSKIVQDFSLAQFRGKRDVLLFFYPKDFTFVCPTELLSFQSFLPDFKERDVQIIGASTDTEETHLAWLSTPRASGGIEGVTYPLLADTAKVISAQYGVLGGEYDYDEEDSLCFEGLPIAYRGTFLIDKKGIVRHESVNDLPLGRNVEEYLRLIDAMHHTDTHGEVCPAGWRKGAGAMQPTREGVAAYLSK